MTSAGGSGSTKNDKRDHAREQARIFREKEQAKQRRQRIFLQGGLSILALAIIAVIVTFVVSGNHSPAATVSVGAAPQNMISDGLLTKGSGGSTEAVTTAAIASKGKPVPTDTASLSSTANIVEYVDFQCPYCNQFESTNLDAMTKWVAAGKATLEIHPIAFLDSSSQGTRYSTRAANAAACVANYDPNDFIAVTRALYRNQPREGTPGLPNSKIISILSSAGASGGNISACVTHEKFKSWVAASTARVMNGTFAGVAATPIAFPGTPAVFVDGQLYKGSLTDPAEFAAFVNQQKPGTAS